MRKRDRYRRVRRAQRAASTYLDSLHSRRWRRRVLYDRVDSRYEVLRERVRKAKEEVARG
jgi:hypothetical protein